MAVVLSLNCMDLKKNNLQQRYIWIILEIILVETLVTAFSLQDF
jgi:hypothetical protein